MKSEKRETKEFDVSHEGRGPILREGARPVPWGEPYGREEPVPSYAGRLGVTGSSGWKEVRPSFQEECRWLGAFGTQI